MKRPPQTEDEWERKFMRDLFWDTVKWGLIGASVVIVPIILLYLIGLTIE